MIRRSGQGDVASYSVASGDAVARTDRPGINVLRGAGFGFCAGATMSTHIVILMCYFFVFPCVVQTRQLIHLWVGVGSILHGLSDQGVLIEAQTHFDSGGQWVTFYRLTSSDILWQNELDQSGN